MATVTKAYFNSSSYGKHIAIYSTASLFGTGSTGIHTAVQSTSDIDELWVYACNTATSSLSCSVCWGSASVLDSTTVLLNPGGGRTLIVDGGLLGNGYVLSAYATLGGYIFIDGFVNQIRG